ncbi:hypothetical protein BD309DRAFT_1043717 [Dichomitus squalens]|uniref:Uncharacterized protein n=1 Tax=Dichomitus squalens TaxID=114155 RepID=A0A4V6MWA5_9APHY|nr:hypothetical protein BD309DRAFT_1043717 [Dichomitus squalens]TBU59513.1 hypothetical protein BD310DRAFT_976549 [Dichomitus squalens]
MSRREGLFPSGSIGRSGIQLPRTASHDSLTAHPLLSPPATGSTSFSSPNTPATAASATPTSPDSSAPISAPRYVPYTPRQRGAPSPATTTTTSTTTHPTPSDRDAANRLHLMNLKAAAQKAGLDAASTGWMILERFALEAGRGPEWNELWTAVSEGKATLLLPRDPHQSSVSITPDVIKDHIAICDAGAGSPITSVITLSGLRGYITDNVLTFRSTLSPSSKPFQALLTPSTRGAALASLSPLPRPLSASQRSPVEPRHQNSRDSPAYPTFSVHGHASSLPLPPRPTAKGPPLPPRPSGRPSLPASSTGAGTRLSNPFASLFGRATTASPTPPASPSTSPSALPGESSSASAPDVSSATSLAEPAIPLNIPAYVIGGRIHRAQVLSTISTALRGELDDVLASDGVPTWLRERVLEGTQWLGPVSYGKAAAAPDGRRRVSGVSATSSPGRIRSAGGSDGSVWEVAGELVAAADGGGIEEVARRLQEFWYDLEDEVEKRWTEDVAKESHKGSRWRRQGKGGSGSEGEIEKDREDGDVDKVPEASGTAEKDGDEEENSPKAIHTKRIMEAVEKAVCSLYYDRLFLPPGTDDASHDEALSSRIAAVNLLDLGLQHLGVEVGKAGPEVETLVKACGQTLTHLDSVCRSPADKAATLVSVHKVLVEGLSRLPPLRLKSDDEIMDEKTPMATSFAKSVHPDDDELDRAVSPPPVVVVSPMSESLPSELQPIAPTERSILLVPDDASLISESSSSRSPILTVSPPPPEPSADTPPGPGPTPVSSDLILPLMIFAVVKANPPHLVSHLLYTQRFRRERAAGGEEGYCLINLMAVAEFLENVDLAALGLGESEKMVISTAELTPIPISRSGPDGGSPRVAQSSLRGRVEQQVDALAGSANKVLTGVVDTSFGVLRAFLPGQTLDPNAEAPTPPTDADQNAAPWNIAQPRFGLLRRDTGFSIASIAASLPGRSKSTQNEEPGQQMIDVPSRPGSSRSLRPEDELEEDESEEDDEDDDEEEEGEHDARSIRSFESMMSQRSRRARRRKTTAGGRKSLADRLASVPGLSRLSQGQSTTGDAAAKTSPPDSRRSSLLLPPSTIKHIESPASSRAQSPISIRISPPNNRFLTCTEDDIKVSEVGELLREYKRLVEAVRAMGGFRDD